LHYLSHVIVIFICFRTWETGYKPHWQEKSLLSWAGRINRDNEHLVRALAGKHSGDTVTELDLIRAKETTRQYIFVGLTDQMEESVRRFNTIMGIHDADAVVNEDGTRVCMDEFFGKEGEEAVDGDGSGGGRRRMKKLNSHPHPMVSHCLAVSIASVYAI
jgi:hypothetical protein